MSIHFVMIRINSPANINEGINKKIKLITFSEIAKYSWNQNFNITFPSNSISSKFISPDTPFSNKMNMKEIILSENYIHWVDKYFSNAGLEILIQNLDQINIKSVKILTSWHKTDEKLRKLFKDFIIELNNNNIECELRVLTDQKILSTFHDRWLITKDLCFNMPSIDVIFRSQYSEIKPTIHKPPFDKWWETGLDIINNWNEIYSFIQKEKKK